MFYRECEIDLELTSDGDARRCPRHPEVPTSSPDGLHDAPCRLCEAEMEADAGPPLSRLDQEEADFWASISADEEPNDAPANDMKGRP